MITSLTLFDSLLATSVALDTLVYPLQKFTWTTDEDSDQEVRKVYGPGEYETFVDAIRMTIDCEGEILADTTTNFNINRKALRRVLYPDPNIIPLYKRHGRLIMLLDGDANTYYTDVVVQTSIFPTESVGSPTVAGFQISWVSRIPFWVNAATGLPDRTI